MMLKSQQDQVDNVKERLRDLVNILPKSGDQAPRVQEQIDGTNRRLEVEANKLKEISDKLIQIQDKLKMWKSK